MNDIDGIRLLRSLRKIVNQPQSNNMIFGEIVSVEPLRIDIGNNTILTKSFLYLGQMCRPHKVTIPHTHIYNGSTENVSLSSAYPAANPISPNPHNHSISNQETEDVHGQETDYKDYVTLEIYPKLKGREGDKPGDIVLMFAMNNNQMYYVAERIEKPES